MSNNDDDDDELSRSFPGENESFFQKFFTNCICKILFVYRTACVGLMTVRGSRKITAKNGKKTWHSFMKIAKITENHGSLYSC